MNKIDELRQEIENIFDNVDNIKKLNELKVEYLGKKGKITELNSVIKTLPNDEKKFFGMKVNEVKVLFNSKYEEKRNIFEEEEVNKRLESEKIDVTLPSTKIKRGSKHPMSLTIERIEDLFVSMGYDVVSGPEL